VVHDPDQDQADGPLQVEGGGQGRVAEDDLGLAQVGLDERHLPLRASRHQRAAAEERPLPPHLGPDRGQRLDDGVPDRAVGGCRTPVSSLFPGSGVCGPFGSVAVGKPDDAGPSARVGQGRSPGTRPLRTAQAATSVREVMASLARMLETWTEAVLVEM
jgi:hypothetical protein